MSGVLRSGRRVIASHGFGKTFRVDTAMREKPGTSADQPKNKALYRIGFRVVYLLGQSPLQKKPLSMDLPGP